MKNQVTVEKITLTVGDKILELTLDEAKNLHQALDGLLAKHFPVFPTPIVINQPYWVPHYMPPKWEITCGSGLGSTYSGPVGQLMMSNE